MWNKLCNDTWTNKRVKLQSVGVLTEERVFFPFQSLTIRQSHTQRPWKLHAEHNVQVCFIKRSCFQSWNMSTEGPKSMTWSFEPPPPNKYQTQTVTFSFSPLLHQSSCILHFPLLCAPDNCCALIRGHGTGKTSTRALTRGKELQKCVFV